MKRAKGDPFGEHGRQPLRARLNVLGGKFTVESADASLLCLAVDAFGGLPRYRLAREPRRFRVSLVKTDHRRTWPANADPPRPTLNAGVGLLCATIDAGNFAIVDIEKSRALVSISRDMLRHPYHARYELIELAVVTLASRAQSLVPLHAACVGARGLGVLLMGPSGAGKSTLGLSALNGGMQFLSEDSAFVAPGNLSVLGVPNYLHVDENVLRFLGPGTLRRQIRRSPVITRRSGVRKFEVNVREIRGRIAPAALRVAATVFLSGRRAGPKSALRRLKRRDLLSRLRREQLYAARLPSWSSFERRITAIPAYELLRTEHPQIAIRELQALLADLQR